MVINNFKKVFNVNNFYIKTEKLPARFVSISYLVEILFWFAFDSVTGDFDALWSSIASSCQEKFNKQ